MIEHREVNVKMPQDKKRRLSCGHLISSTNTFYEIVDKKTDKVKETLCQKCYENEPEFAILDFSNNDNEDPEHGEGIIYPLFNNAILTTVHPLSGYGIPLLIYTSSSGLTDVYGPSDKIDDPALLQVGVSGSAAELVLYYMKNCAGFEKNEGETYDLCRRFVEQWPGYNSSPFFT